MTLDWGYPKCSKNVFMKQKRQRHRDTEKMEAETGTPGIVGHHQSLGERQGMVSPAELPEGSNHNDPMIS